MKAEHADAAGPAGFRLRSAVSEDTDTLCAISLATGHHGGNAATLYRDCELMGLIYAAPYVALSTDTCLVAEDDDGVAGYAVGALDTRNHECLLETSRWPALRARYPAPTGDPANWGSLAFWAAMRFESLEALVTPGSSRHVWMGRKIAL